jgi:Ca2+-binding RTX toxin-like protein
VSIRVAVWTATVAMAVMLLSGVVLAETKTCRNNCQGTNGSDYLLGDGSNNEIYGLRGKDYVGGKAAADTLFGGTGNDEVAGGSGKDRMKGGSGVDTLLGRPGYDSLIDQPEKGSFAQQSSQHGAYQVQASSRPDRLLGGRGNDTIRARDGNRDIIRGGPGYDKAYVDRVDKVTGVEVERCPGGCTNPPGSGGTNPPGGGGNNPPGGGGTNPPGGGGNNPPVAKKDSYSVYEDTHLEGVDSANGVLSNDTDADDDTLTAVWVSGPSDGTLTLHADGSFDYEHTGNCYLGEPCPPDSFTYKANDGAADSKPAEVNITVCQYRDPNPPAGCPPPESPTAAGQ